MELPKRKPNRLSNFNYSQYGSYFITICARDKIPLFCKIQKGTVFEAPAVILSNFGSIIEQKLHILSQFYSDITIEKYVIMPNHIHLIVSIRNDHDPSAEPANNRIPFLISTLKRFSNKDAGINLWHRSYYDHVIRSDSDFQKIWKYIDDNPAKWLEDRFYVPDI